MEVEILIRDPTATKAYIPVVQEGIEWTTERKGVPGKLTLKVLKRHLEIIEIEKWRIINFDVIHKSS